MYHSLVSKSEHKQLGFLEGQEELRSWLLSNVIPKVEKYFYSLLDAPREDLEATGVLKSFLLYFTTVSCGSLYYNKCLADSDAWFIIFLSMGSCKSGGGVAHPESGVVHAVHPGDICIINPTAVHCTSEFGDPLSDRRMVAMYVSVSALKACMTSTIVAASHAL